MCACACANAFANACADAFANACANACECVCEFVCVCVCVCACVNILLNFMLLNQTSSSNLLDDDEPIKLKKKPSDDKGDSKAGKGDLKDERQREIERDKERLKKKSLDIHAKSAAETNGEKKHDNTHAGVKAVRGAYIVCCVT